MLFTVSPYERALERMMQSVPNFKPRCQGVILVSFQYSARMCACRDCTEMRDGGCRSPVCVCLDERMEAGLVSFADLVEAVFGGIADHALRLRIQYSLRERRNDAMVYRSAEHKALFESAAARNIRSSEFLAALYLLTADSALWKMVRRHVSASSVYFGDIRLGNCPVEAYILFMAAKDLYTGSRHMTAADLADRRLIGNRLFAVLCNAVAFRRYGKKALELAEKEDMQ